MTGSHFLHDIDLYNVRLRGEIDVRIARGVSLNAEGNISWVNDQIYLSAEGATDAEALLNLQQRSQDFNYSLQLGFSFQFGSIYNNVVNNRFPRWRRRVVVVPLIGGLTRAGHIRLGKRVAASPNS